MSFKVVYDARETARRAHLAAVPAEMLQIAPGLVLAFMETVVLTSISVAISTRLPMMANLIICAAIYVLGHLVPLVADSAVGQIEFVGSWPFVRPSCRCWTTSTSSRHLHRPGRAGATSLWRHVLRFYSTVAMLLALLLFEDRDLA